MTTQLTQPGHEITLKVSSVRQIESTAKPGTFRYQIDGTTPNGQGDNVFLNTPVVDRELKRLRITPEQLVGDTYRFYRVPAPNNTPAAGYLNIEPASGVPAVPSKRLTSAKDSEPVITPQSLKDDPQGRGEAWEPPEEGPYADAETEREAIEQRKSEARKASFVRYLDLWDKVAAHQVKQGKELDMPVDGTSAQATAATIWITWKEKGIL